MSGNPMGENFFSLVFVCIESQSIAIGLMAIYEPLRFFKNIFTPTHISIPSLLFYYKTRFPAYNKVKHKKAPNIQTCVASNNNMHPKQDVENIEDSFNLHCVEETSDTHLVKTRPVLMSENAQCYEEMKKMQKKNHAKN